MNLDAWRRRFPMLVNSGYAAVTNASAALLLGLLMLAGRFLSAADYGRFSYAVALSTIIETVKDVGLGPVTVRAVAREQSAAGRLFRHVLGLKLLWVAIGLVILFLVTPILRQDPAVIRICYLLGVSSAVRSYLLTARGLLQGLERFDIEAAIVLSDRALLLVVGAAFLVSGSGLVGLGWAFVIVRLLMLVGVSLFLGRLVGGIAPTFDLAVWRELQAAALPLGFFMIALNLYTYIDTLILGQMRTDAEVGAYAAAYRIYEGLTYAPAVLASVLTPTLSALFVRDRAAFRRLLARMLGASVGLGVALGGLMLALAGPVLRLIFGGGYESAVAPLQILSAGALFVFATWILHAAAIATNLDRRLFLTTVVGLVSNVAFNVLLIPSRGIAGAAAATVMAEAITVALLLAQVAARLRQPLPVSPSAAAVGSELLPPV